MTLSDRYRDRVPQSPPEPHPDDDCDLVALAEEAEIPPWVPLAPDGHFAACRKCVGYAHTGDCTLPARRGEG